MSITKKYQASSIATPQARASDIAKSLDQTRLDFDQPSWNTSEDQGVPDYISKRGNWDTGAGCCDEFEQGRQDVGFRNRSAGLLDLDHMLGTIFDGVRQLGVMDNTYVLFSSDNGYHLGEHHLLFGKTEPYQTDIQLPFYIRGPGVPTGELRHLPTTALDITATILDLAGATKFRTTPSPLDGKSFAEALTANPPAVHDWRSYSFSEFYVGQNTWHALRYINSTTNLPEWTFHWWCTNQSEFFHIPSDPCELSNLGGPNPTPWGHEMVTRLQPMTAQLGHCSGPDCNSADPLTPAAEAGSVALPCAAGAPHYIEGID
eukprot:gene10934-1985_t